MQLASEETPIFHKRARTVLYSRSRRLISSAPGACQPPAAPANPHHGRLPHVVLQGRQMGP